MFPESVGLVQPTQYIVEQLSWNMHLFDTCESQPKQPRENKPLTHVEQHLAENSHHLEIW